jgi:hypothetical protein
MTDHANNAAAVAAGWTRTQTDRGAGRSPRYQTTYEKHIGGGARSGAADRHDGFSDVDQATADTIALNSLNGMRQKRYGVAGSAGTDGRGASLSFDA